jgi:hypothetical protein
MVVCWAPVRAAPGGRVTVRVTEAAGLRPLLLKVAVNKMSVVGWPWKIVTGPLRLVDTSATGATVMLSVAVSLAVAPFWLVVVPVLLVTVTLPVAAGAVKAKTNEVVLPLAWLVRVPKSMVVTAVAPVPVVLKLVPE